MTLIRLRDKREGDHVHTRVFMGPDADHLALTGTLAMDVGQWQIFGAALRLGATMTDGQLEVQTPDSSVVVKA